MSKVITIDLSLDGNISAVQELLEIERTIKSKLEEVCRQLAEIGAEAAQRHLNGGYGNTDATITTLPMKNGYKIAMSGADVYFIEFGTGKDVDPHGDVVSVPVYPGSYSETHARQYSEKGFWWYGGEQLEGTPAQMPMFYAGQAIRENARRVAREVFGR